MDAIIFAAGHGTRLRPLTDKLPKPLIQINGLSLIEMHLYQLAAAGFRRVIINLHHLGEMISSQLGNGARYGVKLYYSWEPDQALETAGGIVNALPLLQSDCFAAISADVLCDFPLDMLVPFENNEILGQLVLVDNPAHHPQGDFALDDMGRLMRLEEDNAQQGFTYSGIAWLRRSMFESLPAGKRPLRPVLEAAISEGKLAGEYYRGLWSDIGTLDRLDQARASSAVAEYISSINRSIS